MSSYDLTVVLWKPQKVITFPWSWRRTRLKVLLKALGINAQFLYHTFREREVFKLISEEMKSKKLLLQINDFALGNNIRYLREIAKEKEIYILMQQEESKKLQSHMRFLAEVSKKIFVTQERYRKEWFKYIRPQDREKIIKLPFPVTVGRILPKEFCREKLGIKTKYAIICWGYRRKVKKYDLPLEWIKEWEDTSLLYCGSVESFHKYFDRLLREKIKELNLEDRVFFSENGISDEDADIWFGAADLKVYPHSKFAECSVIDAMGRGKCVVTPDREGFEELGQEGGVIPTKDLKSKVRELLENPKLRERFEKKSLYYREKYNWFNYVRELIRHLGLQDKTPPKVAVCVPVRNAQEHILDHLKSWANTYYPKERIKFYFIDGHSTDRTRELIREFCTKNKMNFRIELDPPYKNPIKASGWIADTMNKFKDLLEDEEWVAIVDSDIIYFEPCTLAKLLAEDKDIIAPYVYTWPSTEKFYDCTLFRKDGWMFGKKAPWRKEKRPIEMESVGSFVLMRREIFDTCSFENPLPTLQLIRKARKLGYRVWALPTAIAFHKVLKEGHPPISYYVKKGILPKEVLMKIPPAQAWLVEGQEKNFKIQRDLKFELKKVKRKRCKVCGSKNIYRKGKFWRCWDCDAIVEELKEEKEFYNVLIIIADAFRYDYFLKSKVPLIWDKGPIFKCITDQIHTGRAVPVLLTGLRRENIYLIDHHLKGVRRKNVELFFTESVEIKSINAWDIFDINGFTLGYINYDWNHQSESQLLTVNQVSLFPSFPRIKNLETLIQSEPFFGVLHFWSTHSPYGFGTFPRNCEAIYQKMNRLFQQGKFQELHKMYQHGVKGFEKQMENLKKILEKKNLLDRTLVVITADHGEALGESGRWGHAATLWEDDKTLEELRRKEIQEIPLLFYHPNLPRVHMGTCKQEDILPTILKLIRMKVSTKFDGREVL